MNKFLIGFIIFSLILFIFPAVAFADSNITINGTFDSGEWDSYYWFTDNSEGPGTGYDDDPLPIFSGYITHDSENLYLAFNVEDNTPNTNRDFLYVTIDIPPVGEFNAPIDALFWGSTNTSPSFFGEAYLTSNAFPWDRSQRGSNWGTDGGVLTARTITDTNRYYEIMIPFVAIGATIGDTIGLKIQARAGQYTSDTDPQVVNFYPDMPDGITPIRADTRVEVAGNFYRYTLAETKADILKDSGIPGKGLENAPGLQKPVNPNSQADKHAGMK